MKKITFLLVALSATGVLFAQSPPTLQLTPSQFGDYNFRCNGDYNGTIDLAITGSAPPYEIRWSTEDSTEDLSGLPAGYYSVIVTDSSGEFSTDEINLTEPPKIEFEFTLSDYVVDGKHYNLSSYSWQNGSITTAVSGGVSPYIYKWNTEETTADISSLDAGVYDLLVTDDLECEVKSEGIVLTKPDRDDWQMGGNAATNPSGNYLGTSDSTDVSLRSNATERMRIKANGKILINKLADTLSYSTLLVDSSGQLLRVNPNDTTLAVPITNALSWLLGGNSLPGGTANTNFLGTTSAVALALRTNNLERMRVTSAGKVLIGTDQAGDQKFTVAHNNTNGGMSLNRLSSTVSKSEIRFERNGTEKWAIGNDQYSDGTQNFFIWDHTADTYGRTRFFIDAAGRTFIGFTNLPCTSCTSSTYKLYVEGGIVTRDVKVTAASSFPDYVFAGDYQPMSIYELEQFIKQNKHLPDFPSAKEIEKNEGFEVGDMQVKMLKKIEEQTLYIIDLQKQVDELRRQISNK
ncbi:MAG: hypothetical protein ACHQNT_09160 [Bacteroidia bacterium]